MKLLYFIMSIILYFSIKTESRRIRLCLAGTDCKHHYTLSEECSQFLTFNQCKPWACNWVDEKSICIPKTCDNLPKIDCRINFNCKWNSNENECVRRQAIFKKLRR